MMPLSEKEFKEAIKDFNEILRKWQPDSAYNGLVLMTTSLGFLIEINAAENKESEALQEFATLLLRGAHRVDERNKH